MHLRIFKAILFFFLTGICLTASAQLHHRSLSRAEGLPSTQAHAVLQDNEGYIWIAGPAGVARYDGSAVKVFDTRDGLSSHGARAIAKDAQGRLWIGGDAGADIYQGDGRFMPADSNSEWKHGFVDDIVAQADGSVWLGTSLGLLQWQARQGFVVPGNPALTGVLVSDIEILASAVFASGPTVGLWRLGAMGWQQIQHPSIAAIGSIRTLHSKEGRLYIGGDEGAVAYEPETQRVVPIAVDDKITRVRSIEKIKNELWIGAADGLLLYREKAGQWQRETIALADALVNDINVDSQGNVWAALDNGGIARFSILNPAIGTLPRPCPAQVFSIRSLTDGGYLIGGDACSWSLDGNGELVEIFAGLEKNKVWDLAEFNGRYWAATDIGLFSAKAGGAFVPVTADHPLLKVPGRVLTFQNDTVILGTVRGLVRLENGVATEWRDEKGASLGYVYNLQQDSSGRLWLGTLGNGLWTQASTGELVRDSRIDRSANIYSIDFNADGVPYVARGDRIVVLEKDGARELVRGDDAVVAWSIAFDQQGALWAGSSSGLVRYDAISGAESLRVTDTTGLPGAEFTTSRSLKVESDGTLLCGLDGGLGKIRPGAIAELEAPEVKLSGLEWTNAKMKQSRQGETIVDHGNWTLTARFFAPWYADEESLQYRHRLHGFDSDWHGHDHEMEVRYTGLPAGLYRLEAQARSPLTGWGPSVSVIEFEVLPPWWLRSYVLVALALTIVLLGWLLSKYRMRLLTRRNLELEARVAARTRELEQAHRQMETLAFSDNLTGLYNQRSFWDFMAKTEARVRRHGGVFALALIDLDHFKRVNDTHGHRVGDQVLTHAAEIIRETVRTEDFLARYGGEEFALVIVDAADSDVNATAERVRQALEQASIALPDGGTLTVTTSVGTARWRGDDDSAEFLFRRADRALYTAKETRNAVAAWQEATRTPELELA